MQLRNTLNTYGSVAKFFHWLIFLLLFCMILYGYFLTNFGDAWIAKENQSVAYDIHKLTGLAVLILMLLRGLWSLINPKPLLPLNTPLYQRIAERVVHYLLYATVIAMPLAGWVGSVAAGRPPYIGNFKFNLPIEQSKPLVETAFFIHNNLAIFLIILFVIHVAAALYHHFIKKDDILRRMLPRCRCN